MTDHDKKPVSILSLIGIQESKHLHLEKEREFVSVEINKLKDEIDLKVAGKEDSGKVLKELLNKLGIIRPVAKLTLLVSITIVPFVILSNFTAGLNGFHLGFLFRYQYVFYALLVVGAVLYYYDKLYSSGVQKHSDFLTSLDRQIIFSDREIKSLQNKLNDIEKRSDKIQSYISVLSKADIFLKNNIVHEHGKKLHVLINENQSTCSDEISQKLTVLDSFVFQQESKYSESVKDFHYNISLSNSESEVSRILESGIQFENDLKGIYDIALKMIRNLKENNMVQFDKMYNRIERLGAVLNPSGKTTAASINSETENNLRRIAGI